MKSTAFTQGHTWTRWRAQEPSEPVSAWTKTHISNTSHTMTLCGLPIPEYPYMSDTGSAQVPEGWPRCKRCMAKVYAWGDGNGAKFLTTVT
jgi:hypothetical protein